MGRINVRVDEDLLEEVDSQGDVRSEVVRDALKTYLGVDQEGSKKEEVEEEDLAKVVEDVVDQKIQEDVYPRLGNIYDKLEEEGELKQKKKIEVNVELSPEVYEFYENYTRAFETPLSEITAELLEDEAHELSEKLEDVSPAKPSWMLETAESDTGEKE